ncbi:MAG: endonuclease III [Acidimicrobiales bacterium]
MARPRTANGRAKRAHQILAEHYEAICELDHRNAYELLTATILSAQSTDKRINLVSPVLFAAYPTPEALASASLADVEEIVRSTGFYVSKAKNIVAMAQMLVANFDGEVPSDVGDLTSLPGVGRKTANLIRCVVLGLPGLPVDTHVGRLARRLELTDETDPVKIERALNPMVPLAERGDFALRLILHGRRICFAKKPDCDGCMLNDWCPSVGNAEHVK